MSENMNENTKHTTGVAGESIISPECEPVDIDAIDSSNIDFNFNDLSVDESELKVDSFQSFNPVKAFSQSVEVNLNKLNKEGYITPKYSNTLLSSTYRKIKRPLLNNIVGKGATRLENANLIMITSSLPSEGKTFSAINLAISIAMEQNKNVLLVDADVNKPSHFKIFDIENKPGLTDLLSGEVNGLSDVLCRTNIPSLSILSAGKRHEYTTELLASDAMDLFIKDVSARYEDRIVIFDSPPLLNTTEAAVLSSHMGQIIMVVEAESTQSNVLSSSLGMLHNEIILLLLNKQREKTDESQYGYGYGQGPES